jgi:glycerol-3-phosphate dehydrogenase (NAD(P)+)
MSLGAGKTIGVIGGGAWGSALAQALAGDGSGVTIWAREAELVAEINETHTNSLFLPGATLAPTIHATGDLADLANLSALLLVAPAQHLARVLAGLPGYAGDLVLCAKGIEAATGRLMTEVAAEAAPQAQLAVLSGPTFAHEVAAGLPTAVTLACSGGDIQWQRLSVLLARPALRPYYSDDLIGAEVGGAVKNVLAIACGVVDGLALGQNARAALIARGYAEMLRFGLARGARAETLSGLCGLGDLVLTCSSTSSRNFSLGKALGEGMSAEEALSGKNSVAEGTHTAPILADLAAQAGIAMPIVDAVARLLLGETSAKAMVGEILARPLKAETGPEQGSGA